MRPLIEASALWQQWFIAEETSWVLRSLGGALLRSLMVLVPWVMLVLVGYKRRDYFLVKGQLEAPAEPVRLDVMAVLTLLLAAG